MTTFPVMVASTAAPSESVARREKVLMPTLADDGTPVAMPLEETASQVGPESFCQVMVSPISGSLTKALRSRENGSPAGRRPRSMGEGDMVGAWLRIWEISWALSSRL